MNEYCKNPDLGNGQGCDRQTKEGREFCDRCYKRVQRRGRQALSDPPLERLPPMERALEAARKWVESSAEDDEDYERNRRSFLSAAKDLGLRQVRERISQGMATAKARGVRLGRPPKLAGAEQMARTLVQHLGVVAAARAMQVDRKTLGRLVGEKSTISPRRSSLRRGEKGTISPHSSSA